MVDKLKATTKRSSKQSTESAFNQNHQAESGDVSDAIHIRVLE